MKNIIDWENKQPERLNGDCSIDWVLDDICWNACDILDHPDACPAPSLQELLISWKHYQEFLKSSENQEK